MRSVFIAAVFALVTVILSSCSSVEKYSATPAPTGTELKMGGQFTVRGQSSKGIFQ